MGYRDVHAFAKNATMNASNGNAPRIGAIVEAGDEHLRRSFQHLWFWNVLEDAVEQIGDVLRRRLPIFCHPALLR